MKKDLKSSKKAGLESAEDRAKKERKANPPPKKSSRQEEAPLSGFSLDSVLSSTDDGDDGPATFGGGGSVVVTSEAKQMQSQTTVTSAPVKVDNTPMPSTNVVSSQPEAPKRGHFSASMASSQSVSYTHLTLPTKRIV